MADTQKRVSLIFDADVSQAKGQINELVNSLRQVQSMPSMAIDPTGIKEANKAAAELSGSLRKAVNVDTGKLDLSRFTTSLSSSGKSLDYYREKLSRIGPEGNKAFMELQKAINNAEVSSVRLTKGMQDFLTTMKNTVKWQISSSLMNNFVGAIQTAYGYAQSLDSALNDIRIVSGASAEEMARFAEQANKSAQALSTTTSKYAEAALIFYQAGFGDQEVKERTETVLKMVNVTREAASDVSSYMMAIWNNFDDGSKSLEYYADVLTKLGAATAASTEEIAGGLEKFAAVADTIGLSYEYAASMITTIVDKTRQSEDVVGNALKTLLARVQGLNLGETLDDGTTLNKYSRALDKVGINIKDTSGELKNMDVILDELGAKWNTLSKDTQVALAQTVGGVRQYNQLISLMDNWDAFKSNVSLAETSSGALEEQSEIYAEGWEAARRRVRAAAEGIYDAIIDEDVFIMLDDIFAHILNGIEGIIKGMGGMMPIITSISSVFISKFAKEIPNALKRGRENLEVLMGAANERAIQTQQKNTFDAKDRAASAGDAYEAAQQTTIARISEMKEKLIANQDRMTKAQIEEYKMAIQTEEAVRGIVEERARALVLLEQEMQLSKNEVETRIVIDPNISNNEAYRELYSDTIQSYFDQDQNYQKALTNYQNAQHVYGKELQNGTAIDGETNWENVKKQLEDARVALNEISTEIEQKAQQDTFNTFNQSIRESVNNLEELSKAEAKHNRAAELLSQSANKQGGIFTRYSGDVKKVKTVMEEWKNSMEFSDDAVVALNDALDILGDKANLSEDEINAVTNAINEMAKAERTAANNTNEAAINVAQELVQRGVSEEDTLRIRSQAQRIGIQEMQVVDQEPPLQEPNTNTVDTIQAITQVASVAMSVWSSFNAVIQTTNTLVDENATAMEKVGAALGLATTLLMSLNTAQRAYKALTEISIQLENKKNASQAQGVALSVSQTVANGAEAISYTVLSGAIKLTTKALQGLQVVIPIIAGLSIAIGVVMGIIEGAKALISHFFKSETQKSIESLTEQTEALSQAQEDLKNHINEVESAWDNYQNMTTALEECTVGTQEWNEALLNCNQAILQLLALSPELAEYVKYNADGSMTIAQDAYDEYLESLTRSNAALEATKLMTSNSLAQAKIKQEAEDNNKFFSTDERAYNALVKLLGEKSEGSITQKDLMSAFSNNVNEVFAFLNGIDYDSSNLSKVLADWGTQLSKWQAYEKSSQAAYATFFGNLEDYNFKNIGLYGEQFQLAVKAQQETYSSMSKTTLQGLMSSIPGGEAMDYKDMSEDAMRYNLAIYDVSHNLETMNGIVSSVNDSLGNLTEAGQSLARNGNLVDVSFQKLSEDYLQSGRKESSNAFSDVPKDFFADLSGQDSFLSFQSDTDAKLFESFVANAENAIEQIKNFQNLYVSTDFNGNKTLIEMGEDRKDSLQWTLSYLGVELDELLSLEYNVNQPLIELLQNEFDYSLENAAKIANEYMTVDPKERDIFNTLANAANEGILTDEQYEYYISGAADLLGEAFKPLVTNLNTLQQKYDKLLTDKSQLEIIKAYNAENVEQLSKETQSHFVGSQLQNATSVEDYKSIYQNAVKANIKDTYRYLLAERFGDDYLEYEGNSEGAQQFAVKYNIFSQSEIKEILESGLEFTWETVAEKYNALVTEALELGMTAWNSAAPERFQLSDAVSLNEDGNGYQFDDNKLTAIDKAFQILTQIQGARAEDVQAFMSSISDIADGLTDEDVQNMATYASNLTKYTGSLKKTNNIITSIIEKYQSTNEKLTNDELKEILEKNAISFEEFNDVASDLPGTIYDAIDSMTDFIGSIEGLADTLTTAKKLKGIKASDTVSESDFELLEKYIPEAYKYLFARSAEGYTYLGSEEQGVGIEQVVREAIWTAVTQNREGRQKAGVAMLGKTNTSNSEWQNDGEYNRDTVQKWILEHNTDKNLLEFLSLTDVGIGNINSLNSGVDAANIGNLDRMVDYVIEYLKGAYQLSSDEENQMRLTSYNTSDELEAARKKGDITVETEEQIKQYDAELNILQDSEFETEMSDLGLDANEVENLSETLQKLAENSIDAELGGEGLSEALIDDEKAAKQVAKALKRYDRALESVKENQEDWAEALESGNYTDMAKAIEEMDEAYSDLLDIKAGTLSQDFLKNADNLELMKEAAEGSEDAYKQLQEAAGKDILAQIGIDTAQFDQDKATIESQLLELTGLTLDDIEVGANLNNTNFLNSLSEIVNAAGMTQEQATAYLGNMGIDAQMTEHKETTEETVANDLIATTSTKKQSYIIPSDNPFGGVETVSATFPQVHYESVPVIAQKETGAVTLEVTSAKKKSGGDFKYKNSTNGSGSGSRRRGSGGSRGGGGGSRAVSGTQKKSSDKERYHTITNQLEDLQDAYDKVSKAADRAFGVSRVKLLQDQTKELKKLAAAQQKYIDEINRYYEQDLSNLNQVADYTGVKIQLDKNGTILNYDAIQDAMWSMYNSHINENKEVIDMDDEAWKAYEEEWEDIMALIEQYEETQDLRKEALQQLQDYINEIYDLQLEEITYAVEIDISASDEALEILDYLIGKVEDDAWSAAEAIAYMGDKAATILDENSTYNKGIQEILMNHTQDITDADGNVLTAAQLTEADVAGFMAGDASAADKILQLNDSFTADEVESLREYYMALIDINESLIELRETVYEKVLTSFEQFNEEMDRSINKIDHLSAITENYRNIVDIVGKKNLNVSNALLESIGQAQVDQKINRVEAAKVKRDTITEEIARAEVALANARAQGLEEDVKLWEDSLNEMREDLDEAEEDFMDSWEEALTSINEQFELAVNNAVETLSDALAGPFRSSMEELQEAFERQNTAAERYLPDYEKIYELNKLNRDITNSIDETDNIKAKEELASLQAEINALEESEAQISEYQMENLRRRYELKLAEIALTEAQNSKSQVQMSRDASGNWNYVYTANDDQVAEAEQNYEDKLFAMQQANAEYINALNDSIVQLEAELAQKIEEIMLDETLSAEERMAKLQEVTAFYQEQMGYYTEQLNFVLGENQILYEEDWAKYSELTGYKISANEDYVDNFNETALGVLTGFETMEEFQKNFNEAIGHPDESGLLYELNNAYAVWVSNTQDAMEAAGTSVSDFADSMADDVEEILDASEEASDGIQEMGDMIVDTFDEIVDAVENWANIYSAKIDEIIAKNEALASSFNQVIQSWSDFDTATGIEDDFDDSSWDDVDTEIGNSTEASDNDNGDYMGQITIHKGYQYWGYTVPEGGDANRVKVVNTDREEGTYKFTKMDTSNIHNMVYLPSEGVWVSSYDPNGPKRISVEMFDTGGYTGTWGREGRLAMLHQKELVLKEDDTANFLKAIDMVRQVASIIDINAYNSAGFGASLFGAAAVKSGSFEQNVHITAEFPNATNREEIYSAFTDMLNLASQYANRK